MKVFFDVGYHHGEGLAWFTERYGIDQRWTVCCLEPNPANHSRFKSAPNIVNLPAAAWIYDGHILLRQHETGNGRRDGDASSIIDGWQHPNLGDRVAVPCVDFAELLLRFTNAQDFVVVKLDIEGAEYEVCRRLLETFAICRINTLHVEFHQRFLPGENDWTTDQLRYELSLYTHVVDHW